MQMKKMALPIGYFSNRRQFPTLGIPYKNDRTSEKIKLIIAQRNGAVPIELIRDSLRPSGQSWTVIQYTQLNVQINTRNTIKEKERERLREEL